MKFYTLTTIRNILDTFLNKNESKKSSPLVVCLDNEDDSFKVLQVKPNISKVYVYERELNTDSITTLFDESDLEKVPSLKKQTKEIILLNFKV